jgi:hypothetical protein
MYVSKRLISKMSIGNILKFSTLAILASCGEATIESINVSGSQSISETELTLSESAFQTTVFPLVRQYCAGCHAEDQAPYIAALDLVSAHSSIVFGQKVDFNNPSESGLVRRLRDLQHNCWTINCTRDAQVMAEAIQAWADALGDSKPVNPINIKTLPMQIPGVLPSPLNLNNITASTVELTVPIANLFDPPMSYAFFKIRIGRNDDTTYLISRPFIVASEPVAVEGAFILMNDVYISTSNIYTLVNTVIPANTNQNANTNNVQLDPPNPSLLSISTTVIPIQNGPGLDMLSFGFTKLERP